MKMYTNPYIFSMNTAGFSFWGKISDRCSRGFQKKTKLLNENQWTPERHRLTFSFSLNKQYRFKTDMMVTIQNFNYHLLFHIPNSLQNAMHQSANYVFNRYPLRISGKTGRNTLLNWFLIYSVSMFKLLAVPGYIHLVPEIKKFSVTKCFAPGVD